MNRIQEFPVVKGMLILSTTGALLLSATHAKTAVLGASEACASDGCCPVPGPVCLLSGVPIIDAYYVSEGVCS